MIKVNLFLIIFIVFFGCSSENVTAPDNTETVIKENTTSDENQEEQVIEVSTEYGEILLWLYKDTPKHRNNFLKLAEEGFYDSTLFHRVMEEFMIQGGDPYSKNPATKSLAGQGGPGYTIEAEMWGNHYHKKGALAAARTGDQQNPERRSSGSQFYIVQGKKSSEAELYGMENQIRKATGNPNFGFPQKIKQSYLTLGGAAFLDNQYTVFGEVISGLNIVDSIAGVDKIGETPVLDIPMDVNVLSFTRKELKEQFDYVVP